MVGLERRVQRWLVGSALVGVLSAGCSQAPKDSHEAETLLKMKAQCREAGEKARAEWIAQYHVESFGNEPEYTYSPALNTCLYADKYFDINNEATAALGIKQRYDRFVVDVYTGKVLLEYVEWDAKSITTKADPVNCRSEREFEDRKAKLFGE